MPLEDCLHHHVCVGSSTLQCDNNTAKMSTEVPDIQANFTSHGSNVSDVSPEIPSHKIIEILLLLLLLLLLFYLLKLLMFVYFI